MSPAEAAAFAAVRAPFRLACDDLDPELALPWEAAADLAGDADADALWAGELAGLGLDAGLGLVAGLADAAGLFVTGGLASGLGLGLGLTGALAAPLAVLAVPLAAGEGALSRTTPAADPRRAPPAAAAVPGLAEDEGLADGSAHGICAGALAPVREAGSSMLATLSAATETPANTLAAGALAARMLIRQASAARPGDHDHAWAGAGCGRSEWGTSLCLSRTSRLPMTRRRLHIRGKHSPAPTFDT